MIEEIWTIKNGTVTRGVTVTKWAHPAAPEPLSVIALGEEGRGRKLARVPVAGCIADGRVDAVRAGKPMLGAAPGADTSSETALVVILTEPGYRGGVAHTGDRVNPGDTGEGFRAWPCEEIARGVVAEGAAGNMSRGAQLLVRVRAGVVFRVARSGRLYGAPSTYYFRWAPATGLVGLTWQERELLGLW